MSNAAIVFLPDGFDTSGPKLMGRQSAGESFLRGFASRADVDRFYFWNYGARANATEEALLRRIAPIDKPLTWIGRSEYSRLSEPGCVFISSPANAAEAWNRRLVGARRYSIVGLTHTTASAGVMDAVAAMTFAPVEPWDALICTSRAVTTSIAAQLAMVGDYCRGRLGATRVPPIRLETIPLGINSAEFAPKPADRARWRAELNIPEDAVAALYVGRFSFHGKMNPVPMAMALERAAQASGREVHWILSGWAHEEVEADYHAAIRAHSPSVKHHVVEGRRTDVRFSIWSAADIFLSLSDNIQESYGLTPVEAMAAGLPSVISDWDGYRDTVRHGIDGFRAPTLAPGPGGGIDMAHRHANGWDDYDNYIANTSQVIAVDVGRAAEALTELICNPDLRRRMGEAARQRAVAEFDWGAVIPRYQALWAELAAIRQAAPDRPRIGENPWRPDPFALFAAYPSACIQPTMAFKIAPGQTLDSLNALLATPSIRFGERVLASTEEMQGIFQLVASRESMTVADAAPKFSPYRRAYIDRGFLWMVKYGVLQPAKPLDVPVG